MLDPTEILVFLGPSLPVEEARRMLPATYLAPAEQGDILGSVTDFRPRVIALIDGVFLSRPSVWHKEILYALSKGIHVHGASSMGALRAAECAAFGMQGCGRIFAKYMSGEFVDDDEVALLFWGEDEGYRAATEPMVNVRATVDQARRAGVAGNAECDSLIKYAKTIYFADRTRTALLKGAINEEIIAADSPLPSYYQDEYVDEKRLDATELLQKLAALPSDLPPFQPDFELANNRLFQTLQKKDASIFAEGTKISRGDVTTHFTLNDADFDYYNFNAMNRTLVQLLAKLLEVTVDDAEIAEERKRFKLRYGLVRDDDFATWLRQNRLESEDFAQLMEQKAICRRLHWWLWLKHGRLGSIGMLNDELILNNRLGPTTNAALMQQQLLDRFSSFLVETEADGDTPIRELLVDHLGKTSMSIDQNYRTWLKEANFSSLSSFTYELVRARRARGALEDLLALGGRSE
jgi:hypothetical protein